MTINNSFIYILKDDVVSTHKCLGVSLESVVCIYESFGNNFEIETNFTKYLKESCL